MYETHANSATHLFAGPQEVFKSDFAFFFAAAALELLTIVLVASTFFGYWRLGRQVSFSPLEIAKAFDAPMLKDVSEFLSKKASQTAWLWSISRKPRHPLCS